MLEMVLEYFEKGWSIIVADYMGSYECEDEEEIAEAMFEDGYVSIQVEVIKEDHQVCIHVSDDE